MSKKKEKTTQTVFVKDPTQTLVGYTTYELADYDRQITERRLAEEIRGNMVRVKVLYRNRTGTWDVLVKTAREVETAPSTKTGDPADPHAAGHGMVG